MENEIRLASEKLAKINENLAKKITARTEFDRTISETEAAYMKILESSQTLLNVTSVLLLPFSLLFRSSRYSNENHIPYVQKSMIKSPSSLRIFFITSDTFICMLERNIKLVNEQKHSIEFGLQRMSVHDRISHYVNLYEVHLNSYRD